MQIDGCQTVSDASPDGHWWASHHKDVVSALHDSDNFPWNQSWCCETQCRGAVSTWWQLVHVAANLTPLSHRVDVFCHCFSKMVHTCHDVGTFSETLENLEIQWNTSSLVFPSLNTGNWVMGYPCSPKHDYRFRHLDQVQVVWVEPSTHNGRMSKQRWMDCSPMTVPQRKRFDQTKWANTDTASCPNRFDWSCLGRLDCWLPNFLLNFLNAFPYAILRIWIGELGAFQKLGTPPITHMNPKKMQLSFKLRHCLATSSIIIYSIITFMLHVVSLSIWV